MSPQQQIYTFTQNVYLVVKGKFFDGVPLPDGTGTLTDDGRTLITQMISWAGMFVDELENEVDTEGNPLDWNWLRQMGYTLGTATEGDASIPVPTAINNLLTDENRYVQILQDGTSVSNWAVVSPDQVTNYPYRTTEDTCTLVGSTIVFSRTFRDYEDGGTIVGDITTSFPRLSTTNVKLLSIVKPTTLLTLGVAKNYSLPDIVQGPLSPSYAQKYADLLSNAILRNGAGAVAATVQTDDYSDVAGIGM